ncbi:MAG: ATP-binding protein [Clostridia bacterium]|nr:ATP-binding protein [Clostridia bacterium]
MKKRILTYFIYVIAAAIGSTTVLLTVLTYNMFEKRVIEDLSVNARVFSALIEKEGEERVLSALDDGLRVTLVHADGAVYFDSAANPAEMGNHANRPEIRQALEEGEGRYVRTSETVDRSTFYYAVRMENGDALRVAEEASSIWSIYIRALPLILLIMLLMMALSVYAASVLTRRLIEPIEQMTAHLDHMEGVARYPELEPFMGMIKKQHEEILKSADMRVEFTANVSHELKTPLTSISGYAELIESGMATGEQATRFAGEIHKSANRLLALINDIIRLSQMDSPAQELAMETVDLAQIAANVVEQLRLSAQKMEVSLELDARTAFVQADRRMMEELLYNLCDNAIRYNVRGGAVHVTVHPARERAIVTVQDTGIGISKENQAHVFERFYRVDKSRSKATGGTGLGLAIVKHIAAKHGADIEMDSELGRGTRISVSFERTGRG